MIGLRSGKVIAYSTRNKRCAVCQAAERSGRKATSHDCRLNWSGSSKAMEPDVAAELANNSGKYGAQISVLVGDDDSATIKKVRESVQHDVDKWSDIVHAKRSLATSLYALQPKHKGVLSGKVIEYLLKCFGYALKQNKDNQSESNCSTCIWQSQNLQYFLVWLSKKSLSLHPWLTSIWKRSSWARARK